MVSHKNLNQNENSSQVANITKEQNIYHQTQKIMQEINDKISSWIYEKPGQWFWHHRRWKI